MGLPAIYSNMGGYYMGNNETILTGTSFERPGTNAVKMERPPYSWDAFLIDATGLFVRKSTDYQDRYVRALIELDARTIWAWEIDKKLDRLRTWLQRGELQVKGEGVRNSVDDLFIYTVQYVAYVQFVINGGITDTNFLSLLRKDRDRFFIDQAAKLKPVEWVEFLVQKERVAPNEKALQQFLRLYMGDNPTPREWQEAIKAILAKA